MRYAILTILLLMAGCTSWHNPNIPIDESRGERFVKDRAECRKRAQKISNAAPLNDQHSKTYSQNQDLYTKENQAFQRCMSAKGWVKK